MVVSNPIHNVRFMISEIKTKISIEEIAICNVLFSLRNISSKNSHHTNPKFSS